MTASAPFRFRIRISYDADDHLWYADCLDLQGCHTFGESRDEAREQILEVIGDRLYASAQAAKERSFKERLKGKAEALRHHATTETVEIGA